MSSSEDARMKTGGEDIRRRRKMERDGKKEGGRIDGWIDDEEKK